MTKVFISYRHNDTEYLADSIYRHIKKYTDFDVFFDKSSLQFGHPGFESKIQNEVRDSDCLIVVIGKRWLSERLENEEDPVRNEIELAIKSDVRILPVLVNGAKMPGKQQLPESLKMISDRIWQPVNSEPHFDQNMESLLDTVDSSVFLRKHEGMYRTDPSGWTIKLTINKFRYWCSCFLLAVLPTLMGWGTFGHLARVSLQVIAGVFIGWMLNIAWLYLQKFSEFWFLISTRNTEIEPDYLVRISNIDTNIGDYQARCLVSLGPLLSLRPKKIQNLKYAFPSIGWCFKTALLTFSMAIIARAEAAFLFAILSIFLVTCQLKFLPEIWLLPGAILFGVSLFHLFDAGLGCTEFQKNKEQLLVKFGRVPFRRSVAIEWDKLNEIKLPKKQENELELVVSNRPNVFCMVDVKRDSIALEMLAAKIKRKIAGSAVVG